MDISKARRLVELEKEGRKVLLTVWEGDQISSCVEEKEKTYCETCQCDDEICQEYIEHMKAQGYGVTEVKLGELKLEESLPRFLEEREVSVKAHPVISVKAHPIIETEEKLGRATQEEEKAEEKHGQVSL